ncbi:hypothetical protein FOQG_19117 [Fusarium oxysporum f. sp. raphani 54005]|uniref:Uncharacterized protein n=2 Tax=Fusarium oxysporum TaxID=5507 RepID=X0B1Y2_FUSOX|nr:hypothetical protein FOQG_19117 [Fusarium oxysporum f. sp. raphani 54005]EXL64325.1 hypothetical protein FOPG_19409 [Fusarium oxysporum f. sp. conglutinans race 2 54008]
MTVPRSRPVAAVNTALYPFIKMEMYGYDIVGH